MTLEIRSTPESEAGVWFAPDVGDNRTTRKVEGRIVPMTGRKYGERRARVVGAHLSKKKPRPSDSILGAEAWRDDVVATCVREVRGVVRFAPDDPDTPIPVTTGAELVTFIRDTNDPALSAWLDAFAEAVEDASVLAEGARPKSGPASESSRPGQPRDSGAGAARGAAGRSK